MRNGHVLAPSAERNQRLLDAVRSGNYEFDFAAGDVTSKKTGRSLARSRFMQGDKSKQYDDCVTLWANARKIETTLARAIWTADHDEVIPVGWEIHHVDGDHTNNAAASLVCLHRKDHERIH